jgi:hypothetical protein
MVKSRLATHAPEKNFIVNECNAGDASGVFLTRCSVGATAAEKHQKLALSSGNTAKV